MAIQKPPADAGIFGQGIKYPPQYDGKGRLKLSWGLTSVDDSMLSIARTQLGERVMQPDYGGNVGLGDLADLGAFRLQMEACIAQHDPRVQRALITVSAPSSSGQVEATIAYTARGEANERVLTFPLFTVP